MITPKLITQLLHDNTRDHDELRRAVDNNPVDCNDLQLVAHYVEAAISKLIDSDVSVDYVHIEPGFYPVIEVGNGYLKHKWYRRLNTERDIVYAQCSTGENSQTDCQLLIFTALLENCRIIIKR